MKYVNKIISALLLFVLVLSLSVLASADEIGSNNIFDFAGFLTSQQEEELAEEKARIEREYGVSIMIYFTRDKYPSDIDEDLLLDRMYDDSKIILDAHKTDNDAILYYMSLDGGYRDYFFNRTGICMDALEDGREVEVLKERAEDYMTQNDFYGAAKKFLEVTDEALLLHSQGKSIVKKTDILIESLPIVLIVSLVVAAISVTVMKSAMKSVKYKRDADMYANKESFNVRAASDIFLYRRVSRQRKPENNSSSGGRSGGSRGGGGRC